MAIIRSADQISIVDVTDAYSVILTSEAYTFAGSVSTAKAGSTTTQIIAMRGAEQMNASVTLSEITKPSGVTVTSDNNAKSPTLTISVSTSVSSGGVIKIPVHIGDITITKEFSFAIAFTGATGAAGNGVKSTSITYQKSLSGTTTPTGTWSTSIPSVGAGEYLWTKTVMTYTDNTTATSYSVGMMGATGATGKGIKSTKVTYQKASSGTTAPAGTWNDSIPSASAGEYIWTRTVITYTDDATATSYSVGMIGATGAAGNGVQSTAITYQKSSSGTITPTGTWETNIPSVGAGEYLWTRTVTTYTDGTKSTSYSVGMMGATGAAGKGIKSTEVTYQKSSNGTTEPTGTWVYYIPSASAGEYIWTRTVVTYTDDTKSTSYSVGMIGATGAKGAAGADAFTLSITSSNGTIFKNSAIETVLTAHVYKGGRELTESEIAQHGQVKWYKDGSDTPVWNGITLTIDAGDVTNKASYIAALESNESDAGIAYATYIPDAGTGMGVCGVGQPLIAWYQSECEGYAVYGYEFDKSWAGHKLKLSGTILGGPYFDNTQPTSSVLASSNYVAYMNADLIGSDNVLENSIFPSTTKKPTTNYVDEYFEITVPSDCEASFIYISVVANPEKGYGTPVLTLEE